MENTIKLILADPKNKLTESSKKMLKCLQKDIKNQEYVYKRNLLFTIIDLGERHCPPEWIPQRDSNFVSYIMKKGLLDVYEKIYGPIAKKYKPKEIKKK